MSTEPTEARAKISGPFESSWRKIARAEEHYDELRRKIDEFVQEDPYERVIEPNAESSEQVVHKIRLTKPLPFAIADITGDIVQNLRNALDNAGYAVSVASGKADPKFSAFPFAGSLAQMPNSLGRSKDLPQPIQSLFFGFQPYFGGDDMLWALNEMCIADKHKMVLPIGTSAVRVGANVHGKGYFSMPDPHVWNREKNEMELITVRADTEFNYEFDFRLFVAINGIRVVDGKPVLSVLHQMGCKVHSIMTVIDLESRRLGYIS